MLPATTSTLNSVKVKFAAVSDRSAGRKAKVSNADVKLLVSLDVKEAVSYTHLTLPTIYSV